MNRTKGKVFIFILLQLLCIVLLLWQALYNGYPLLNADSGSYIASGHSGYVPVDRPILYGLFVRHLSLSWSLWLVVIVQAALVNYLVFLLCKFLIKSNHPNQLQLLLIAVLSIGTSISYYVSFILADIFTPIGILSLFLLIYIDTKEKLHRTCLAIMFLFSIIMHLSHIPLVIALVLFSFVFLLFYDREIWKEFLARLVIIASLIITSLLLLATINYNFATGFKLTKTSNFFFAARLIESGIANKYLKENCNDADQAKRYDNLCSYIDQFHQWPSTGVYLFAFDSSPIYQGDCMNYGWGECWERKDSAYGRLVTDIVHDQTYWQDIFLLAVDGTWKQLNRFELEELNPSGHDYLIERHFKGDLKHYKNALQTKESQVFSIGNTIERYVFYLTIFSLLMATILFWKKIPIQSKLLIFIILIALIVNALFTSTLSNVVPRYHGRIVFLVPLMLFTLLIQFKQNNKLSI